MPRRSGVSGLRGSRSWLDGYSRYPRRYCWPAWLSLAWRSSRSFDRGLQDSIRNYGALAEQLEEALAENSDPVARDAAIAAELEHIKHGYGTVYVGLFAGDGRLFVEAGKEAGRERADPARLAEVASTGTPAVETEEVASRRGVRVLYSGVGTGGDPDYEH